MASPCAKPPNPTAHDWAVTPKPAVMVGILQLFQLAAVQPDCPSEFTCVPAPQTVSRVPDAAHATCDVASAVVYPPGQGEQNMAADAAE